MYIGIDPGKNGGFAGIEKDGTVSLSITPVIGKGKNSQLDGKKLREAFKTIKEIGGIVVMEYVHTTFIGSKGSNFTFGQCWGQMIGMMDMAEIVYHLVPSKTWQAVAFQGIPAIEKAGTKAKGTARYDTKAMALIAAQRLYPHIDLTKPGKSEKPHDGMVDALLMAHYCKLKFK